MPFEWVKLELLPGAFNASLFEGVVEAVKESGIMLTTLAQLGNTVAQQRHMFELNRVCAADIPERGEFHTWDQYVERRIEVPRLTPRVSSLRSTIIAGLACPQPRIEAETATRSAT